MALAEISLKDEQEEEAIDGLERLINLYPENYLCEKAYFLMAEIYRGRVTGPSYDQGSTLKALNFLRGLSDPLRKSSFDQQIRDSHSIQNSSRCV